MTDKTGWGREPLSPRALWALRALIILDVAVPGAVVVTHVHGLAGSIGALPFLGTIGLGYRLSDDNKWRVVPDWLSRRLEGSGAKPRR